MDFGKVAIGLGCSAVAAIYAYSAINNKVPWRMVVAVIWITAAIVNLAKGICAC